MFPRLLSKLMEKIDIKKEENLKSEFIKAGICPINKDKLLDRLTENQNNCLDEDLIGESFLEQIQKERENFIGGSAKPRKKNCKCYQVTVFHWKTFKKLVTNLDHQINLSRKKIKY